jgi:hypothetical protein
MSHLTNYLGKTFNKFTKVEKALREKILTLNNKNGLHDFLNKNCFIAGGAVRDLLRDKTPKDYDIFFKSQEAVEEFKAKYLSDLLSLGGYETSIGNYNHFDFQFITLSVGQPEDVIRQFDWNVNMVYFDLSVDKILPKEYDRFNNNLSLNLDCIKVWSAMERLPYFISKGFDIDTYNMAGALTRFSMIGPVTSYEKIVPFLTETSSVSAPNSGIEAVNRYMRDSNALNKALKGL